MALLLNDEQTMLRESARGFLAEHAPLKHMRALRDARDATGFSRDLWARCVEMGFAGILTPEAYGGLGLGQVEACVVMEEMGRTLTPSPFLSTALLAATALTRGGSAAQKAAHLPAIAAGERIAALAVDERAKHAPRQIALKAVRSGNGFALTGAKSFVVDGHVADVLIVAARTSGEPGEARGLTLFLVDRHAHGLSVERTIMVDSRNAARIAFDGVEVDADAVLGEVDEGFGLLEGVLDVGRVAVAAELVGAGEEAFSMTVRYLKDRKQFGRAIGEYQALQHRAAHCYSELEITRSVVLKAAQALDGGAANAGALAAIAKARAGRSAALAVQESVQMHGGMGMTDDYDVGLFMKRVRVGDELFGDGNFHAQAFAVARKY